MNHPTTTKRSAFVFSFIFLSSAFFAQTPFKPVTLEIKNERAINTKALEFSPTFYEDGIVFISTNNMGSDKMEDRKINLTTMTILRARRGETGDLTAPTLFAKDLTSRYHEGPICFDQTTEQLFFTRNSLLDGKERYDKNGVQRTRIYLSTKSDGKWSEPFALPFNDFEFDDFHPVVDITGEKLYFASNRPGGMGGLDLYVSEKKNNVWGQPVNLGTNVNTPGDEAFPFIHPDGSLYFASKGHNGAGGFDLFYSEKQADETWARPFNLGTPFNTNGDDFGLIVDLDKRNGYFSSNGTPTGAGADDILSFHTANGNLDEYFSKNREGFNFQTTNLIVDVVDKATEAPLPKSMLRIFDLREDKVVSRDSVGNMVSLQNIEGQVVMKTLPPNPGIAGVTNKIGRFQTDIDPAEFAILVSHEGYQTEQLVYQIKPGENHLIVPLIKADGVRWNTMMTDMNTGQPMKNATVVVTNPQTGKRDTLRTDPNGMIDHYLPENQSFQVDVYRDGKLVNSSPLNTHGWSEKPKQVPPIGVGEPILSAGTIIELTNIYYNFNDDALRPDAVQDLDATVLLMKQYPNLRIELGSHTDCRGSDTYNEDLSARRSRSAVGYLIQHGIEPARLEAKGYGESKLKNHCADGVSCSEKEHARNRRTELRVLSGAEGVSVRYLDGSLGLEKTKSWRSSPTSSTGESWSGTEEVEVGPGKPVFNVIAGSFLIENGAKTQLSLLKKAGYEDAQIKKFGKSPFFSVVAKQCDDMDEAATWMRQLINKDQFPAFIMPAGK